MTSEGDQLDPSVFTQKPEVLLYRLARTKYANLSGVGAALYPGRWNRLGQQAIYTSIEMGVPVLERLVHTPKETIPSNLTMMHLTIKCDWRAEMLFRLHKRYWARGGGSMIVYRDLQSAKQEFAEHIFPKSLEPFAIALPSVIVPVWNVVLYPSATGFWDNLSLKLLQRFEFDSRLCPENALDKAASTL